MFLILNLITTGALAISLIAFFHLVYQTVSKFSFYQLHRDRRGVSYSLTMIITLPFYLAMVTGAIEANWMFHTNTLFQRAAMMTGRSVSVTYQNEFEENLSDAELKFALEQNGKLAASLVLFSAGSGLPDQSSPLTSEESKFVAQFLEQLAKTTQFTLNEDTRHRAASSLSAIKVQLANVPNQTGTRLDRLIVKIDYEHPFFSQPIGRFFGHLSSSSGDFYVRRFSKTFETPLEIARSSDQTLGIK